MATAFSPEAFARMTFKGANATESVPIPVGDYPAQVSSCKIEEWKSEQKQTSGLKLNVIWKVDGNTTIPQGEFEGKSLKEVTGRDENTVRQELFLDMAADSQMLDMGKGQNVGLGRLREAIGLNDDSVEWSFDMFPGKSALISVKHRTDTKNPGVVYSEVKAVAPA